MQCANCGKQVPDTARVCGYCGQPPLGTPVKPNNGTPSWLKWLGGLLLTGVIVPVLALVIRARLSGQVADMTSLLPFLQPTPAGVCDQFTFLSDVTVPDGTTLDPGESFDKIWQVQNTGTCTWTPDYQIIFFSGEKMEGADATPIGMTVEPGQTADLVVHLRAPSNGNTYRGYWLLRTPSGQMFGMGPDSREPIWVEIQVVDIPPTATIIAVIPPTATESVTRCDLFEETEITIHWVAPQDSGTVFQVYATMPDGIPGLGKKISGDYADWEYQFKIGNTYTTGCEVYKEYVDRLYCDYPMPQDYANSFQPVELSVKGCSQPIFTEKKAALPAFPETASSGGNHGGGGSADDSGSADGGETVACSSDMDSNSCAAAGGSYHYTFCQIPPCIEWCACP